MEVRGLPIYGPEYAGEAPMVALAERYRIAAGDLDGWAVAVNLTRSGCRIVDPGRRFYA